MPVPTVRATRVYVALFALITALIALNSLGGIVSLTSFSGSLYAACFLAPLMLGLFWSKGDGFTAFTAIFSGVVTLLLWRILPINVSIHPVFPAIACSSLAYIVFGLSRPANPDTRVKQLFEK